MSYSPFLNAQIGGARSSTSPPHQRPGRAELPAQVYEWRSQSSEDQTQEHENRPLLVEPACSECNRTDLTILTARQCSYCVNDEPFFCIACTVDGCSTKFCTQHETCWDTHLPKSVKGAQKHEMIHPLPQLFVEAVTRKETDPAKQKRMHQRDELARWFNIKRDHPLSGRPDLHVYDRFAQLCDPNLSGNQDNQRHYPSFVSFVGDTSVGKSTLVRAMLLMGIISPGHVSNEDSLTNFAAAIGQRSEDGPVTKSGFLNDLTYPTTCGVHLYRDEGIRTITSGLAAGQYPILFADCEGFKTGSKTGAERAEESADVPASPGRGLDPAVRGRNFSADPRHRSPSRRREATLTYPVRAMCYSDRGKDGIDLFYARFLYAISDVIVFVTKEDAKIKSELTRVLEWASKAVHKSVNHPSRKTLIIVRNMANDLHDSRLYDNEVLKRLYLYDSDYPKLWHESSILQEFVNEYNGKKDRSFVDRITTNDRLYKALFNKITCCYVPHRGKVKGKPQELFLQYQRLRITIEDSVREGLQLRAESVMQYNVPALTHILNRAFEHFTTSEQPFDFHIAARKDNPNPQSMREHLANFLRHIFETDANEVDDMAKDVISVALLIFTHRNFERKCHPKSVFPAE